MASSTPASNSGNLTPFSFDINDLKMSTREIAELCDKQHKHVIRDFRKLCEDLEIGESKFGRTYLDTQNKEQIEYLLDKELTLTLVSGYNVKIRHKIVQRWIELETKDISPAAMILKQAHQLYHHDQRLSKVETRQEEVDKKLEMLNPDTGYRTITAHCRVHKIKLTSTQANVLGRKAAAYCKKQSINIGSVPDERYGSVNSYPVDVLDLFLVKECV